MKTEIIAEAGVNHNGSLDRALDLVNVAAQAGANCVKFQTFVPEEVISQHAAKAEYQKANTKPNENMLEMVREFCLDDEAHRVLLDHCKTVGISFLSSPFDLPSVNFLITGLRLNRLKIPSGEITNLPLLLKAARLDCDIILSTGMSTLEEVERALGVLAFGGVNKSTPPSLAICAEAYESVEGRAVLAERVTLLHCTTEYPTPYEDVNLQAIDTLASAFGLPVGLSDHTQGIAVAIAAVGRGATVIEKHFTLDRTLPGPDHAASLEPDELTLLVKSINSIELAIGDGIKRPAPSELKNISIARKCLIARTKITAGQNFTDENLTVKRGDGPLSAELFWDWLNKSAGKNYEKDEAITL